MEPEKAATEGARASSGGGEGGADGSPGGGDLDRLSALPDSLLHTIMSYLKARQAVQTCLLSTRWRHLWHSMPCLDVDHDEFRTAASAPSNHHPPAANPDYSDSDLGSYDEDSDDNNDDSSVNDREWDDFEDFAENLMHRCNIAQLETLRLHVNRSRAPRFADKLAGGWLRRAMKYCTPDPPRQREGMSHGSWLMKRMYLCNVALDNRFSNHLLSVCLLLEDLELDDCSCEIRSISSHSLKTLVLKNCRFRILSEITSPTLKRLVISGGTNSDDYVLGSKQQQRRRPATARASVPAFGGWEGGGAAPDYSLDFTKIRAARMQQRQRKALSWSSFVGNATANGVAAAPGAGDEGDEEKHQWSSTASERDDDGERRRRHRPRHRRVRSDAGDRDDREPIRPPPKYLS
nr:unnamed protein product [Digitaria exilis]